MNGCLVCGGPCKNKFCSFSCRDEATKQANREKRASIPTPPAVFGARWIALTCDRFVLVDAARFDELSKFVWYFQKNHRVESGGYAARRTKDGIVYLHRFVMEADEDQLVDHRDRNTLDCRRKNLRFATSQESNANRRKHRRLDATSRFKGVRKTGDGRWVGLITIDDKTIQLGIFASEEAAAHAYDEAARKAFGHFAATNS